MVQFMSADWAKAPPMWSNIILDVSRRMFVDEMNILICGLRVKQVAPRNPPPTAQCVWASTNQLKI